jgi:transcriptional regulator of acetoin/glycerol metabolism
MGKTLQGIDGESMNLLCQYSWPGNVRELENVIERAVALAGGSEICIDDLPEYIRNLTVETYRRISSAIPTLEEQEISYLKWVLEKCDWNKTKAAKIMDIDRVSLWRKMKRLGIESE